MESAAAPAARVDNDNNGLRPREPGDRCRYADARPQPVQGEPRYATPYDADAMARGVAFRCVLRDGGPEARLVLSGEHSVPLKVDVYLPAEAQRPLQRLLIEDNDQRALEGDNLLEGFDLNRDGWTDVKVQTWSGTGGIVFELWMYDPRRHRFAKDPVLPGGAGVVPLQRGEPCVGTGIYTGGGEVVDDDYCWRGGGWVLVRQTEQKRLNVASDRRYVHTLRELRGGRMVTVSVDTSTDDLTSHP